MSFKNLTYFAAIGIVGGFVIGIVISMEISPIIAGLVGGIIIFSILLVSNLFGNKEGINK